MNPLAVVEGVKAAQEIMDGVKRKGFALWQILQARKLQRELGDRPVMQVPSAQKEAVGNARRMAGTQALPGQDLYEQSLDQNLASGVGVATNTGGSSSETLGALTRLFGQRMNAQNDINKAATEQYVRNQVGLRNELGGLAETQMNQFMFNKVQPWMDKANAITSMKGAGIQNYFGANTSQGVTDLLGATMMGGVNSPTKTELSPEVIDQLSQFATSQGLQTSSFTKPIGG